MSSVIRAATQPRFASNVRPRTSSFRFGIDGRGISGARRPEQPGDWAFVGVGIPSMRERLRQNGGELEILSTDQGTTLIATVPLDAVRADQLTA